MTGVVEVAGAVVKLVTPFLPFLADAGKAAGKKLAETVAARGGEAAWTRAQSLWQRVSGRFADDQKLARTADLVAVDPEDEDARTMLIRRLAERLEDAPDLAQELEQMMGGQQAVMEVIGGDMAQIRDIRQSMAGSGRQRVEGGRGAVIERVSQEQGFGRPSPGGGS